MALKTFNLDAEVYKQFSAHCKKEGHSMSKKIENFIRGELENLKGLKGSKSVKNVGAVKVREHSFRKYC